MRLILKYKGKVKSAGVHAAVVLLFFIASSSMLMAQPNAQQGWQLIPTQSQSFFATPHFVKLDTNKASFHQSATKAFARHPNDNPNYAAFKDSINAVKRALHSQEVSYKNNPDSVAIRSSFEANPVQNFTPMDNHMAIGENGILVSCVNANFAVYDTAGNRLQYSTFRLLAGDPQLREGMFDPRVIYDLEAERFVMMILHGSAPDNNRLLIFVSKTSNPLDGWHYLNLSGNAFNSIHWSDFPHLAVSKDYVYISTNLFEDLSLGNHKFMQSVVWSIAKTGFYEGNNTAIEIIYSISTKDGHQPFTLYPAMNPLRAWDQQGLFFVSTATSGGDYVDLIYIEPKGQAYFKRFKLASYEAPADVFQSNSGHLLDAGDNRITGGFIMNDLVHFTFQERGENLKTRVRYVRLDLSSEVPVERFIQTNYEAAYSSIAPLASNEANGSVVVNYLTAGINTFPSMSFAFFDQEMVQQRNEFIAIGQGAINVLQEDVERWGDYTAAVVEPNTLLPTVWVAGSIVNQNGRWENRVARIQGNLDTLTFQPSILEAKAYPNPFLNQLNLDLFLDKNAAIEVSLYTSTGSLQKSLMDDNLSKGVHRLVYRNLQLSQGLYYLRVMVNGKPAYEKKLLIKE